MGMNEMNWIGCQAMRFSPTANRLKIYGVWLRTCITTTEYLV